MTKDEAKYELASGKKLTHRYFSKHEYVYQEGHRMYMEDGASIEVYIFWNDRTASGWNDGWKIFNQTS